MGQKVLVAAAPLVVVRDTAGRDQYVYRHQPVTFDIPAERRAQLVDEGMLVETEVVVETVEVDVATTEPVKRPAKNAALDLWRHYAVEVMDFVAEDVDQLTKADLITAVLEAEEEDAKGTAPDSDPAEGATGDTEQDD